MAEHRQPAPPWAIFSAMMTFVTDETHGVKVRSIYSQLNSRVRHAEVGWRLHRHFDPDWRSQRVTAGRSVNKFGSFDPDRIDRHTRRYNPRVGQQPVMCDTMVALRGPMPASPTTYLLLCNVISSCTRAPFLATACDAVRVSELDRARGCRVHVGVLRT